MDKDLIECQGLRPSIPTLSHLELKSMRLHTIVTTFKHTPVLKEKLTN